MFSCRRASFLMSEDLDRELTGRERLYLRAHLCICAYCRRAVKHFVFLREMGRTWLRLREEENADRRLSEEARQRILRKFGASS